MTSRATAFVLLLAGFSQAQQAAREPALPAFHAQTALVMVPFQVSHGKQYVSDLKQSDIVLLEDGIPRSITVFEGPQSHKPVELVLLFDTTTWPMGPLWNLKATYDFASRWDRAMSQAIVGKEKDEVRASVYHFDGVRLERLCPPTADPQELLGAFHRLLTQVPSADLTPDQQKGLAVAMAAAGKAGADPHALERAFRNGGLPVVAGGETVPVELPPGREVLAPEAWPGTGSRGWPLEAAIAALNHSAASPDRVFRRMVMFSMGIGGTTTVPDDVADKAVALGIPVYPVVINYQKALAAHLPGAARSGVEAEMRPGPRAMAAFGSLGKWTGGRSFETGDMRADEVLDILETVRNEGLARAHSEYNVGFAPPQSSTAPREHKLEIRLTSKSGGKLIGGKRRVVY